MKNVDQQVRYLKTVNAGMVEVVTSNSKRWVGLAPFHDWEDKILHPSKRRLKRLQRACGCRTGYRP